MVSVFTRRLAAGFVATLFTAAALSVAAVLAVLSEERRLAVASLGCSIDDTLRRIAWIAAAAFLLTVVVSIVVARQLVRLWEKQRRATREAEAAARARDRFLSLASHEFKTPLTPIALQLQLARRELSRSGEEDAAARLTGIERRIEALSRLVDGIIVAVRLVGEEGGLELRREEVDLAGLVREVARRAEGEYELHAPARLDVMADRSRLALVLFQLFEHGAARAEGRPVPISLSVEGAMAHVEVRILEPGAEPDAETWHAERFEETVSERHYRSGAFGLWMARRLLEAMGGALEPAAQRGGAAALCATLPIAKRPEVQ